MEAALRDPRYDILFEPMAIGPVTAKNRFYQVPHCNGGGYRDPSAAAEMRGIKAEGGWGVIFTEQTEMHHTSEITPFIELRLWEDQDIPALRQDVGTDEDAWRAGGHPACLFRHQRTESLHQGSAARADSAADPHIHQRSGAGAGDGQDRYREPAPLVRERGEAIAKSPASI